MPESSQNPLQHTVTLHPQPVCAGSVRILPTKKIVGGVQKGKEGKEGKDERDWKRNKQVDVWLKMSLSRRPEKEFGVVEYKRKVEKQRGGNTMKKILITTVLFLMMLSVPVMGGVQCSS